MKSLNARINAKLLAKSNRVVTPPLSEETKSKVLNFYLTERYNGVSRIAKHFGISYSRINTIINEYLKSKKH